MEEKEDNKLRLRRTKKKNVTSALMKTLYRQTSKHRLGSEKAHNRSKYLQAMERLLNLFDKSKIRKMTNQVRSINFAFQQYLNHKQISYLKFQHVYEYQHLNHKQQADLLNKLEGIKHENKLNLIKLGFETLKQKMEQFQIVQYINQVDYAQTAVKREAEKLNQVGDFYLGAEYLRKPSNIIRQLSIDEEQNGRCEQISKNVLKKTGILQKAEKKFMSIILQNSYFN